MSIWWWAILTAVCSWIMSRERSLPKATWDRILERLKAQHYDPARLIDVPQAAAQPD